MTVLDASVVAEIVLRTRAGEALASRLLRSPARLAAPHLLDAEVAGVVRRLARAGDLSLVRGGQALLDLADFPIDRFPHTPLLARAWALRDRMTAYDAMYVALAEALEAPLLTRDARLARTGGHRARVEAC